MYEIGQSSSITSHQVNGHIESSSQNSQVVQLVDHPTKCNGACKPPVVRSGISISMDLIDMHLWIPKFSIPFKMPLHTSQCLPKSICAVSSSNEKKVGGHDPHQLQDDTVTLRLPLFGACSIPHLSQNKNDYYLQKSGLYILYHITYIYILYLWVLKSARFGGGITAWSFRGEFFGCKAWSFPQ